MRLVLLAALASACTSPELPTFPSLLLPDLTLNEGASTTFPLRSDPLPDPEIDGELHGSDLVTVTPATFALSTNNYPAVVTVTSLDDTTVGDMHTAIGARIYGDLLTSAGVTIIDDDTLNFAVSEWSVNIPLGGGTSLGVRLTKPPASPLSVTLQTSDPTYTSVAPTILDFDGTNFDTFQMIRIDGASSLGATIELAAPGVTTRQILVHLLAN